ncbi:MAG TPA: hypothetical protein VF100_04495 [Thermoanaerobaculia bacterium]
MQRTLSLLVAGAAALALAAPAAALDVDLVVQMPLAVVEVEDAGYPRDDLALLSSGLIAAELEPVEVIDTLRWAPVVWLLDELAGDEALFLDAGLDFDPEVRRLRLIEDRDGRFLVTTREDLVFVDLADPVVVERQFLVDRDRDVIFDDRVRDRDGVRERDVVVVDDLEHLDRRGMGAYVQFLHEQGLRGRELADAIHAELNRRGVPAGPKDRLDGPPPVSRRFVVAQAPERVIVDGREVVLLDRDVDVDVVEMRFVPPPEVRRRLAEAPRFDRAERIAALGRPDDDERGGRGRTGPPAERGRAAGRDDRGGGPPDHAANRGRGGDDRGGPPAARGDQGRGGGGPKADRGNSGRGGGAPKADRGNSGGGQGKGKGNAGGGNRGQGGGGKGKGRG